MDNYYNSFELAFQLLTRKTYCTGTIRVDRKCNPKEVKETKLKKAKLLPAIETEWWLESGETKGMFFISRQSLRIIWEATGNKQARSYNPV